MRSAASPILLSNNVSLRTSLLSRRLPGERPLDPVAPHLVVDARAVDAEALGGLALVPAGQAERLRDRELLHLLQREVRRHERMLRVDPVVDLLREVLRP